MYIVFIRARLYISLANAKDIINYRSVSRIDTQISYYDVTRLTTLVSLKKLHLFTNRNLTVWAI